LVDVVNQFFDYKPSYIQEWEAAVNDFSERIPELAAAVKKNGLAHEFVHSAQDDRVGIKSDLECFRAAVKVGQRLAEIYVHYEQQPEHPLTKREKEGEKLDYRVTKMRLSKDKTSLIYNQFLTLSGIPPATYEYRLGNRSTLEWVIDQYQVSTDKRSGITNDPNRSDDPTYILRLIAGRHCQRGDGEDRAVPAAFGTPEATGGAESWRPRLGHFLCKFLSSPLSPSIPPNPLILLMK
jgi:hypothetical protein